MLECKYLIYMIEISSILVVDHLIPGKAVFFLVKKRKTIAPKVSNGPTRYGL